MLQNYQKIVNKCFLVTEQMTVCTQNKTIRKIQQDNATNCISLCLDKRNFMFQGQIERAEIEVMMVVFIAGSNSPSRIDIQSCVLDLLATNSYEKNISLLKKSFRTIFQSRSDILTNQSHIKMLHRSKKRVHCITTIFPSVLAIGRGLINSSCVSFRLL